MAIPELKELLEAGVHFGHQTKRWNPKMKPYIFGERNGIYIVNLEKTTAKLKEACEFLKELASRGGKILFVGTKKQAQEVVREEAARCGMFYVTQRWLGGALTNFETIRKRMEHLKELRSLKESPDRLSRYTKKEQAGFEKKREKLERSLGGLIGLEKRPDGLFVIDSKKEAIAVEEASRLGIPVVGLVDTNCDPDKIQYVIPGNDDALRAIRLMTKSVSEAILEGRELLTASAIKKKEETDPVEAAEEAGIVAPEEEGEVPGVADIPKSAETLVKAKVKSSKKIITPHRPKPRG